MPKKAKLTSKEKSIKLQEKPSLSQEEVNSLEQMLDKDEEKIDFSELKEFLNEPKTESSSPSLKKINPPQKNPVRLEGNFIETPISNNELKEEEENPIKYNLINKKNEQEYQVISQDNRLMQKESIRQNTNIIVKNQSLIDLNRKNIVENFQRRTFNPIVDEDLKNIKNTDKNYIVKSSFVERERKPHNPFERKEIKYDNFEQ